jgi:hypothetical protein
MSEWLAAKNRQALARLNKPLPAIFPAPALHHALRPSFIPAMPRRAVDSYWRSAPDSRRSVGAGLGGSQRRPGWLGVASRRRRARLPTLKLPRAAGAVS